MQDSKKEILSWALYDWANSSFATTVMAAFFPIFFSQYWSYGAQSTTSTFYLGLGNSLASVILAVIAPVIGAIADKGSYRKKLLILFAFLGAAMTFSLAFVQMGMWPVAILLYIFANIGFSGSTTLYDSLLPSIASEKKIDAVSSLGYALGYIGGGLLFLVNVIMYLFPQVFGLADGVAAVKASYIMVGIWWVVFTLPLAFFVEEPQGERITLGRAVREGFSDIASTLSALGSLRNAAMFLVAYWCYIDGVDTIIRMATDYGTSLGFSSSSLIVALLITQFVAFPSAILYGMFCRKCGVRNALLDAIGAYIVIAILGFFMTKEIHFYLLAVCIGLFQGGIQALSRSYFAKIIPAEKSGEYFGIYDICGKGASVLGTALVSFLRESVPWQNAGYGAPAFRL